jgi:NADPH2:quinone reductase
MRAAVAREPGPPSVLELRELPDPVPAAGEVVVAVAVAATTFVDTQLRAGAGPRPVDPSEFPLVLGNGVAGTVVELGEGVDPAWEGERVVTTTGGRGGYASRAVAAADDLHRIPAGVDERTAVAVLADGRTALALTGAASVRGGEVVAVTAAAGGLGSLIVQLAVAAGARVVALAGGPDKVRHARSLGAAEAVDYRADGWASALGRLDVVFDGVGGDVGAALAARLAPGGRYVQHGAASGTWADVEATVRARGGTLIPLALVGNDPALLHRLVDEALELAADGALRPTIGQVVPLERAGDAHAAMEARQVIGKTLLVP